MIFAHDYNDQRVYIDDTHSNQEYYCPYCGAPLVVKKGEVRQHHFAHKQSYNCSDSWERERLYDISPWHNEWQALFPKENQEVKLSLGETTHRADVMVYRTVVEFQHSITSMKPFEDRNNFYLNLGCKVVWLFDLTDLIQDGKLIYKKVDDGLEFYWGNPKRSFNNYDVQNGDIDLFFQISEDLGNSIVRVKSVSEYGFEKFFTTNIMSRNDFLSYVGLKNGMCLPPFIEENVKSNQKYCNFKERYKIKLNSQQERAVLAVEGSNLLLAVPGSGKTTVLVERLGYMIFNKNIDPQSILAITYNKNAAEEMRRRFSFQFDSEIGKKINFHTINSLANKIYIDYYKKNNKTKKNLITNDRRELLKNLISEYTKQKYVVENDILELSTAITYIKNMMIEETQICAEFPNYEHLYEMYKEYNNRLEALDLMDFDDQMIFAYEGLLNDNELLREYRGKYKYICVDEAQDTSKIQHEIIKILAQGNNIFMVGDEDQSIYGFRAAYPKALLNFKYDYINPYILRMEKNYRSTPQIVNKAQLFISQNKGRYNKNMTSSREDGADVKLEVVQTREEQFKRVVEIAKTVDKDTAILYRDNESAIILLDLFLREGISFKLRKPEMNFFECGVVKDVVAYLSLAINDRDTDSFEKICNKGVLYLKKSTKEWAINNCKKDNISICEALQGQMKYIKEEYRDRAENFQSFLNKLVSSSSYDAINVILKSGYDHFLEEKHLDKGKVGILSILAKQEPQIKNFLNRLKELEKLTTKDIENQAKNSVALSTIHSSKGLEYDSVLMIDVYDGRFPSALPNIYNRSKDSEDGEKEERRLFYVGITRAKNNLTLFEIKDYQSKFIDAIFPEKKCKREKVEGEKQRKNDDEQYGKIYSRCIYKQEGNYPIQEQNFKIKKEDVKTLKCKDEEKETEFQKWCDNKKDAFDITKFRVFDPWGRRVLKCKQCGHVKLERDFSCYGGEFPSLGVCTVCLYKDG